MRIVLMGHGLPELIEMLDESAHTLAGVAEILPLQRSLSARQQLWRSLRSVYRLTCPDERSWERNAKRRNIPFLRTAGTQGPELASWLRERNADLFLDYASPLLPRSLFEMPSLGTVNIHPAFLPKYRGPNPLFWMLYDLDPQPGVTLHFIDEGMDTGPVLAQGTYSMAPGWDAKTMRAGILAVLEEILAPCLDKIAAGTAEPKAQPAASPTPVARNVRGPEYRTILEEIDWEPARIATFLLATQQWLDVSLKSARRLQDAGVVWSAAGSEPISCEGVASGSLLKIKGCYYLAFPSCRIRLKRQRHLKTLLKDLLLAGEPAPY